MSIHAESTWCVCANVILVIYYAISNKYWEESEKVSLQENCSRRRIYTKHSNTLAPQYFTDCVKHATPCQMLIFHRWPLLINIDTCACVYCVCVCVPWSGWLCFFGIQTTTNFMILRRNWRSGSHTHLTFHITISQYIVSVCVFVGIISICCLTILYMRFVRFGEFIRNIKETSSQFFLCPCRKTVENIALHITSENFPKKNRHFPWTHKFYYELFPFDMSLITSSENLRLYSICSLESNERRSFPLFMGVLLAPIS